MKYISFNKKITWLLLLMYFVLAFSVYPEVVPQRGFLMMVLVIVALVLLKPGMILRKRTNSIIKYLIILFVLNAISNFFAGSQSINHMLYMIQYICLVSCMWVFCSTDSDYYMLIRTIFWPSFIGGPIIGIYQLATGRYLFGSSNNLDTFFSAIISNVGHANSNYTAISMLFSVALAGVLAFKCKKTIYWIALVISCICIILTYSRTSIVATAFCIALFIVVKAVYGRSQSSISVKKLLAVIIVFALFIAFYGRMSSIVESYLSGANLSKLMEIKQSSTADLRTNQWGASFQILFTKSPIEFFFGFGDNAADAMSTITGRSMSAHNFLFGRLSENGVIGFIVALILYIQSLLKIKNIRRTQNYSLLWLGFIVLAILLAYLMISIMTWELICALVLFDIAVELENGRKGNNYE